MSDDPWGPEDSLVDAYKKRVLKALADHKPRKTYGPKKQPASGFGYGALAGSELSIEKPKKARPQERIKESIALLESMGYLCDRSSYYNPYSNRTHDLFGIFDLVAVHPQQRELIGVQVTSLTNKSARLKKINASQFSGPILRVAGVKIQLHLWHKDGSGKWKCKIEEVTQTN